MDTQNNRVVMLNQAGEELSEMTILQPLAAAQDTRLDLIVAAYAVDPVSKDTIGIIVRVELSSALGHLDQAKVDTVWREAGHPQRRFVGVGVVSTDPTVLSSDDEYLVARDGPDNSSPVDPDARVLLFRYVPETQTTRRDSFITPLGDLQTGVGGSITSINHPTGLATFPGKRDFVIIQKSVGVQYSALWMVWQNNSNFQGWLPKFDPAQGQGSIDFILPNRFLDAEGVAIDQYTSDIFIADAAQDSVAKFNVRGFFQTSSFGSHSLNINLNHPQGLAVAQGDVYVCDTDNNRIVEFRASTGQ
jgi:NHL repeat